jgi:hypothetical protein
MTVLAASDGPGAAFVVALIIAIVLALAAVAVLSAKRERERTESLQRFAAERGLRFIGEDAGLDERMAAFDQFQIGHSRRGLNLMEGDVRVGGIRGTLLCGDYRYKVTRSNGKQTTTTVYNMSFVAMRPALSVPEDLTVRAEGVLDKIGAFVGFDDIDFESSEFSKRFHVKCSDRRFAFDVFDPRMMEYFLAAEPPRVQARAGVILIDRGVRRWEPSEFAAEFGWLDGFLARVPRHVRAARLPESEHPHDPVLNPSVGPHADRASGSPAEAREKSA